MRDDEGRLSGDRSPDEEEEAAETY